MPLAPIQPFDRLAAARRALSALFARRRPRITVLCMALDRPQQARVELRIERPAASAGWTIRRIEPLTPLIAGVARRADEVGASALDVTLSPRPDGLWFAGDATLWLRYAAGAVPAHRVRLRLTLEHADGRRRPMVVSAVFPAMRWTAAPPPPRERKRLETAAAPLRLPTPVEARSWTPPAFARTPDIARV